MKKTTPIRVLLVDDHFVVRLGLASLINSQSDMKVIAEAANGTEALVLYEVHQPDLVLMDLRLPGMSGIDCTRAICTRFPGARVVVLTTFGGDENMHRALQAGARAYLLKDVRREDFLNTVRSASAGECQIAPDVAMRLLQRQAAEELSAREMEVLGLVATGRSNKEIADRLAITESTVKNHMTNILNKLRVPDRAGAVAAAMRDGLLSL
ncbi:MAG: DNA-binding response regulator, NarL/FixJ family, containings and domain [Verrucomicrobiales bacterium]|nr:DNA-binding response regulator, NarL/FixJ family, containings and domain [Verrucomicrobiales bacterium]MDB6130297.1 DNA-binding response regulator, NarL/FixJ family, containings and domain [Verrucomicrobiales bacterium]